jgi:hypothetical protein
MEDFKKFHQNISLIKFLQRRGGSQVIAPDEPHPVLVTAFVKSNHRLATIMRYICGVPLDILNAA